MRIREKTQPVRLPTEFEICFSFSRVSSIAEGVNNITFTALEFSIFSIRSHCNIPSG